MYIAQNICSNVRELEGCLTRLAALASITSSPITLEFARQGLRDLIRTEAKPHIEGIQRMVSECFHICLADLKSKKRTQHVAFRGEDTKRKLAHAKPRRRTRWSACEAAAHGSHGCIDPQKVFGVAHGL
jgi:chromosomal replication initiation ATPase DnaA